jgi:hypothetical protein
MAIEHKRLGKHGVLVSNICLGTTNFGWHTTQEESFKIMIGENASLTAKFDRSHPPHSSLPYTFFIFAA